MKNFTLSIFALAFIVGGIFTLAPLSAEASCSENGYFHSGGKCNKGFMWRKHEREEKNHSWSYPLYGNQYTYNTDALQKYIDELLALIERLRAVQNNQSGTQGEIRVSTQSATDIEDDSVTFRALIDMDDEDEGELFFEYGTAYGNLNKDSDVISLDEDDDGDTLEDEISGLVDNTRYYYRAVVEDKDGDKRYGTTLSFITDNDDSNDDNNDNDAPDVTTLSAQNVDSDSANLRGEVDMNDYENGKAFFVYGEDESQIEDVEDDFNTYSEVDEDGDDLRKVEIDGDVDGTESYTREVTGLDDNTDTFFTLCVEYDDEGDDETLVCDSVRSFETD